MKITGYLASLFGLSSALFAQLYKYVFAPNMFRFFMILAIVLGVISVLGALTMNVLPSKENPDESPLLPEPERPSNSFYSLFWIIALDLIRQYNPLQLFITLDFYAFFVAFICGVGSGLVVVNNIGATWLSLVSLKYHQLTTRAENQETKLILWPYFLFVTSLEDYVLELFQVLFFKDVQITE